VASRVVSAVGVLILLVLACGREVAPEVEGPGATSPVVARVDGAPIRVEDVVARAPRGREPREPRERVEAAIDRELIVQEARSRQLDEAPGVRQRIAAIRRKAMQREEDALRNALFESLRDEIALTEEELQQHYQDTEARYSERQIHLRRAVFDSKEAAEAADAALGPAGRLDPESSEDVGPAIPRDLPRSILPEALHLRMPGERVVVGRGEGWSLVELVEILAAVPRPFEEVRDRVEASLRRMKAQQAFGRLLERLRAEAEVEIEEGVLADDALWRTEGSLPAAAGSPRQTEEEGRRPTRSP
jgi:hypothetical protein